MPPSVPASPSATPGSTSPAGAPAVACVQDNTIVEFRIIESGPDEYKGEFGFDWLRVKEAHTTWEDAYIDAADASRGIVLGGYKSNTANLTHTEAKDQMRGAGAGTGDYDKFTINRSATTHRLLTYYVPYLNLFPLKGVLASPVLGAPRPPHRAKLRMLIDVKDTAPEKVTIEYNSKLLSIEGSGSIEKVNATTSAYVIPKENSNYTPTGDDANTSKEVKHKTNAADPDVITITCWTGLSADQEIKVYAHMAGCTRETSKKLAGKMVIRANDRPHRKTLKIAFVRVRTNITGAASTSVTGFFAADEVVHLYNVMYQALIYPMIKTKAKNIHGVEEEIILDLTANADFRTGGKYVFNLQTLKFWEKDFGVTLEKELNRQYPNNRLLEDYFLVFNFDELVQIHSIASVQTFYGNVDSISWTDPATGLKQMKFLQSEFLYKTRPMGTFAHELLHGLQLRHTHSDTGQDAATGNWNPVGHRNIKYFYENGNLSANKKIVTTNVMSYNHDQQLNTWRWQWKIMQDNVTVKARGATSGPQAAPPPGVTP